MRMLERAADALMYFCAAMAVVTVASFLAACTTTASTGDDTVAKTQAAAKAACAYLPTAETVADIIKAGDPRLSTAKAIADAICAALNPSTPAGIMTLLKPAPTVDGVVIRGEHVE